MLSKKQIEIKMLKTRIKDLNWFIITNSRCLKYLKTKHS